MARLEFNDRIRRIPTYPAAAGYSLSGEVAMLASNESPFAPLPEVLAAAQKALVGANRYPDPHSTELRRALAARYELPASRVAVGNGSCDILLAAGEALLEPGAEVIYGWPSFSIYPHLAAASGARAVEVPLDSQDRHDLDAMAAEVNAATRLVIVCNPNNPTSTVVGLDAVVSFLEKVPSHLPVILDEAYCEFSVAEDPDATLDLLARFPNLVLLRTFSKVHGLCGLRVGYALCGAEEFRHAVDQVRQPFFLNAAAQAAAREALRHGDAVLDRVEKTIAARLELDEELRELGLEPADSQANFVWFGLGEERDEAEIVRGLSDRGVLVRAGATLGREGWLRVTVGTRPENARFVAALSELL
ncbi:MAG: histidinol-phosphate transaminase [Solirubrobacteraceae bacterium]